MAPKKPFNTRLWNYLGSTLQEFADVLSAYLPASTPTYKVYTVLLSQQTSGSNPIVVSELENTFTGITFSWTRTAPSQFQCIASGDVFTTNKTIGFAYSGGDDEFGYNGIVVQTPYNTPNVSTALLENECRLVVAGGFDYNVQMRVEIRVYN